MHVRLLFSLSLALAVFISPKFSVAGSGGPMAPTADHMGLAPGHDKPPMANPPLAQAFAAVFGRSAPATRVVSQLRLRPSPIMWNAAAPWSPCRQSAFRTRTDETAGVEGIALDYRRLSFTLAPLRSISHPDP
jgi:hypothetical protein